MSVHQRWHEETQSAWIYDALAKTERDPSKQRLFTGLAEAARRQAAILAGDLAKTGAAAPSFTPELRARFVTAIARRIGVSRSRPLLAALKVRGLGAYGSKLETGHPMPESAAQVAERHHKSSGAGNLRAAVFGVNDGLVSNASLLLGLAGAGVEPRTVLFTGIAGLLAGAFSMASGEYVSVRSQRELYERQIGEEREELARYPEEEAEELALIYHARGLPLDAARVMSKQVLSDPERALDALSREELGLDPDNLGSPWGAASSSFAAFALGAALPLVPWLLGHSASPLRWSIAIAAIALFAIGALLTLFSGRHWWFGGARMLAIGAGAGALTYAIGHWIGVSVA